MTTARENNFHSAMRWLFAWAMLLTFGLAWTVICLVIWIVATKTVDLPAKENDRRV